MTNQITPTKTDALYSSREDIREMGARIKKFLPGGERLTEIEAYSTAQLALIHDLDPFNGEVYPLKKEDGTWLGVMIGIKGTRKHARRQAERLGATYWLQFDRVDPGKYDKPSDCIVYECRLTDSANLKAWGEGLATITRAGATYKEAWDILGGPPATIGVGIASPGERTRFEIHARARKRAEADALKQRFDISFAGLVEGTGTDEGPGLIIEGSAEDIPSTPLPPSPPQVEAPAAPAKPRKTPEELAADLGF